MVAHDPQPRDYERHAHYINGLGSHYLEMQAHVPVQDSIMCRLVSENNSSQDVIFVDFCPGSVIVYEYVARIVAIILMYYVHVHVCACHGSTLGVFSFQTCME